MMTEKYCQNLGERREINDEQEVISTSHQETVNNIEAIVEAYCSVAKEGAVGSC